METSEWLQVIAGFGTFFVVLIGVTFGGLQLRQEAKARHLQSLSSLFTEVWPFEMFVASRTVRELPDNFASTSLTDEQTQHVFAVTAAFSRLGYYLQTGLVTEKEVFEFPAFGMTSVYSWAKVSHFIQDTQQGRSAGFFWFEYLAQRAQAYWLENGGKHIAKEPIFAPDPQALLEKIEQAQAARKPTKGAVEPEAA